jgi:hypothetical protein
VEKMNKKMWASALMALVFVVYSGISGAAEKAEGKAAPTITASFAASEMTPGATWKIYLKASDPDGDMRYIVAVVKQAGTGVYRSALRESGRRTERSSPGMCI